MNVENIVLSRKEGSVIEVAFDIPRAEVERCYKRALLNFTRSVQIPGFRKGKAPESAVEREYGERIAAMAEDLALHDVIAPVIERAGISGEDILDRPVLRRKSEFKRDEPFKLEALFSVAPPLEPDHYRGIELHRKKIEVSEEKVADELGELAERNAVYAEVDRPAKEGDRVSVNATGSDDGGDIPELTMENYVFVLGRSNVLPEFRDNVLGMSKGEKKDFHLTFPADYHHEKLKGRKVKFSVELAGIKEPKVPAIDDEFAKDLNFENLEALKQQIRHHYREQEEREARNEIEAQLLDKLREKNPVSDLPRNMVEEAERVRWHRFDHMLESMGMTREQFYVNAKRGEEDYRREISEDARKGVHAKLIIRAVARKEGIEVTDQELGSVLVAMARREDKAPDAFLKKMVSEGRAEDVKIGLIEKKTLDFLLKHADIKEG